MIFPLGFFEKFKETKKEKEKIDLSEFQLSAFKNHQKTTKQEFANEIKAILELAGKDLPSKIKRPEE